MKIAVMISNMGGPDSLEAVEPYLYNIFCDPHIIEIPLPGFLRKRFAKWLAQKRTPNSTKIYRQIGDKTPLIDITKQQADALEKSLNAGNQRQYKVFVAMRYWHPLVEDVFQTIVNEGFIRLIVVSLYPFYTKVTTQSLVKLIKRLNVNGTFKDNHLQIVDRFGNHPAFIKAMGEQINSFIFANQDVEFTDLLFSAHSIPMKNIKKEEPYRDEIESAVASLRALLPDHLRLHLSYQSKIGPLKWLGPATPDKIDELTAKGVKNLLVYPLGFVADNSETVYEIDILYRKRALEKGIDNFVSIEALNTNKIFINGLMEIVLDKANKFI